MISIKCLRFLSRPDAASISSSSTSSSGIASRWLQRTAPSAPPLQYRMRLLRARLIATQICERSNERQACDANKYI